MRLLIGRLDGGLDGLDGGLDGLDEWDDPIDFTKRRKTLGDGPVWCARHV